MATAAARAKFEVAGESLSELLAARQRQSLKRWLAFVRQHRLQALQSSVTACLQAPMFTPRVTGAAAQSETPQCYQPVTEVDRSPDMLSAFWTPAGHVSTSSMSLASAAQGLVPAPPPPPARGQGEASSVDVLELSNAHAEEHSPGHLASIRPSPISLASSQPEVNRIEQKLDALEALIQKTVQVARPPADVLQLLETRILSLEKASTQKDHALQGAEGRSLEAQNQLRSLTARAVELEQVACKAQEHEAQLTARCAELEDEACSERQKATEFQTLLAEASIRELFDCGKNFSAVLVGRKKPVTEGDHLVEELCQDQAQVDEIIRLASALFDSGMFAKLIRRPILLTAQLLWHTCQKLHSMARRDALQGWRRKVIAQSARQEVRALHDARKMLKSPKGTESSEAEDLASMYKSAARTPQLTPRTDVGSIRSRLAASPLDGPGLSLAEGSEPAAELAAELADDSPPRMPLPKTAPRSSFVLGSPLAEEGYAGRRPQYDAGEATEVRTWDEDRASAPEAHQQDHTGGEPRQSQETLDDSASVESLSALLNFS